MRRTGLILAAAICCAMPAFSQGPAPQGGAAAQGGRGGGRGAQGPQVVSPQVNADRTVVVRVFAPKATEITVTGELINGAPPAAMTKGDDGIWTATLGPLRPDVYTYAFNIDGVNTTDPRNPWVKLVSRDRAGLAGRGAWRRPAVLRREAGAARARADHDLRVEVDRRDAAGVCVYAAGI
jgi:hypothetical protein